MTRQELEPIEPGSVLPYVDEDSMSKAKLIFHTAQDPQYRSEMIGALQREPDLYKTVRYASRLLNAAQADFVGGALKSATILFILEREGFAKFPKVWSGVASEVMGELKEFDKDIKGFSSQGRDQEAMSLVGGSLIGIQPEQYLGENPHLIQYILESRTAEVISGGLFVYKLKRRQAIKDQGTSFPQNRSK